MSFVDLKIHIICVVSAGINHMVVCPVSAEQSHDVFCLNVSCADAVDVTGTPLASKDN
jgi:hypothetical protein